MLDIQTETDVASILNSYAARQPDSDALPALGGRRAPRTPTRTSSDRAPTHIDCGVPINDGADAHRRQGRAAQRSTRWVATGTPPVTAPRIDVTTPAPTPTVAARRRRHRARRHPHPAGRRAGRRLSGAPGPNRRRSACCSARRSRSRRRGSRSSIRHATATCRSTMPRPTERSRPGFVLDPDRAALLAFAKPSKIGP